MALHFSILSGDFARNWIWRRNVIKILTITDRSITLVITNLPTGLTGITMTFVETGFE